MYSILLYIGLYYFVEHVSFKTTTCPHSSIVKQLYYNVQSGPKSDTSC